MSTATLFDWGTTILGLLFCAAMVLFAISWIGGKLELYQPLWLWRHRFQLGDLVSYGGHADVYKIVALNREGVILRELKSSTNTKPAQRTWTWSYAYGQGLWRLPKEHVMEELL